MNHDDTKPDLQPLIEMEIEARLVALVLGEASAFEIAELERLCREKPELGIFKRRIEAVHGLVGEAARPDTQPLRLSPERREKVLQVVGGATEAPTPSSPEKIAREPLIVFRQQQRRDRRWMLGIAAGIAIGGILAVLSIPTMDMVEGVFEKRPLRPNPSQTVLGGAGSNSEREAMLAQSEQRKELRLAASEAKRRGEAALEARGRGNTLPISASPTIVAPPGVSASFGPAPTAAADGTIAQSPFVVTASEDAGFYYQAQSTLAGTRLRTELKDIDVGSISVVTKKFMEDTGATSNEARVAYTASAEGTGRSGIFAGSIGIDPNSVAQVQERLNNYEDYLTLYPRSDEKRSLPGSPNSVLFGLEESAAKSDRDTQITGKEMTIGAVQAQFSGNGAFNQAGNPRKKTGVDDAKAIVDAERGINRLVGELEKQAAQNLPTAPARKPGEKAKGAAAPDETSTAVEPVSTFSLHVSDASFQFAKAALDRGEVPDPARIRPEEFYNAFDYGDPAPAPGEKIGCRIEQAAHPFLQQRNLVRIAMRVPATGRAGGKPLHLTVLLDTSGSMERDDRRATVQHAMTALASLLKPEDRITLIGFARQPRLLAENLSGDEATHQLRDLVTQTPAEGGTNLEAALALGIEKAQEFFDADAQNRVVLMTDGAANLGNANPAELAKTIETARQQGIAFDACGVGTDGLDDEILEALTRKGDGRYYVLDAPEDADAGFAHKLAGAFRPAAQNVKMQVRFNPARVAHYRLIGFEQHRLREEDFRNDKVDAAELAAEEAAVAVYQVEVLPGGEGELGDVFVRFRDTSSGTMVENFWTMAYEPRVPAFDQATPTLQLAGVAALLAEKLRGGAMADLVRLADLAPVVNALRDHYGESERVQDLLAMFEQMRRISGE